MQDTIARGRTFREAWIAGVIKHHPGEPKPAYIAPWEQMPPWEQTSAIAVYQQIAAFIETTAGATSKLTREQRGRWVALCWLGQVHRHIPDPKPAYIADWEQLPAWQREVDADIFDAVQTSLLTSTQQI